MAASYPHPVPASWKVRERRAESRIIVPPLLSRSPRHAVRPVRMACSQSCRGPYPDLVGGGDVLDDVEEREVKAGDAGRLSKQMWSSCS